MIDIARLAQRTAYNTVRRMAAFDTMKVESVSEDGRLVVTSKAFDPFLDVANPKPVAEPGFSMLGIRLNGDYNSLFLLDFSPFQEGNLNE